MATKLTDQQRDVRRLRTALRQADVAVQHLLEMHDTEENEGLKCCKFCFEAHPCETRRVLRTLSEQVKRGLA